MKAAAWRVKSQSDYCNGRVIGDRSIVSWVNCEHKNVKRTHNKWISHKSIFETGIFNHRTISVVKSGYTVWCRDCNKVMSVYGG